MRGSTHPPDSSLCHYGSNGAHLHIIGLPIRHERLDFGYRLQSGEPTGNKVQLACRPSTGCLAAEQKRNLDACQTTAGLINSDG